MTATATDSAVAAERGEAMLQIRNLKKHFPVEKGFLNRVVGSVKAVDGLSFDIYPNETVGLVGESGCGKTTAGRSILRLLEPTDGDIFFRGQNIVDADPEQMRQLRRQLQIIFQDPQSSLNPRMTIEDIVGEAILFHGLADDEDEVRARVQQLLELVGLQPSYVTRYPHEFSGGQRQRIGIARALALDPEFIVCDEAVSALDVSVQAQVINLLMDLQDEFNLSYLFIAHDLAIVRHISDRIAVMYLGQIMELAETEVLFDNALHPYTQSLLSAIPEANPRKKIDRVILEGDVPSPIDPPSGCRFHTRCPARFGPCDRVQPRDVEAADGHQVACHLYDPEYSPADESVWKRVPRLPKTDGIAELPPEVVAVIEELTSNAQIEPDGGDSDPEQDADDEEQAPEDTGHSEESQPTDDLSESAPSKTADDQPEPEVSSESDDESKSG